MSAPDVAAVPVAADPATAADQPTDPAQGPLSVVQTSPAVVVDDAVPTSPEAATEALSVVEVATVDPMVVEAHVVDAPPDETAEAPAAPAMEPVADRPQPPNMCIDVAKVDRDAHSDADAATADAPLIEPDVLAGQTGGEPVLTEQELQSVDQALVHQRIDELLSRYAPRKPVKPRRKSAPAQVVASPTPTVETPPVVDAPEQTAVVVPEMPAVSLPTPPVNHEQPPDAETPPLETQTPTVVVEQPVAPKAEEPLVVETPSPAPEEPATVEVTYPAEVTSQEEPASEMVPEVPQAVEPESVKSKGAERSSGRRRGKKVAEEAPEAVETSDATTTTASGASAPEVDTTVRVIPPMYVVMVTPEMTPVAKVGGLADVVIGLARELVKTGNTVEVVLPKYNCLRYDQIQDLCPSFNDLWVPWFGGSVHCTVFYGKVQGINCYFIDAHSKENFFNRGFVYGNNDDLMRFAFFCEAALEYLLKSGKRPEVIHCHDWATGLVPVLLFEQYAAGGMGHCRVCYTIHNFKHQGSVGDAVLHATGLGNPGKYFSFDKMRDNNNGRALNLMKSGIVYSNFTTTVSPHYAWDARFGGQGFGMEPTLNAHHMKYGGIINGIDYEYWDPATDIHIPHHFSAADVDNKYKDKKALRDRFMLADSDKPIIAFVGRLDPQKGLDMVEHAIFYALSHRAQFVLLGNSPDNGINGHFWNLKRRTNDSPDCHLEIGFNEELAHLIYAGSDMMVVPSRFEPCGLTQLIALRYGSVPIVRAAGGLIDTVFDKDYSDKPIGQRNGYVFNDANNGAVSWALDRAISCYFAYPEHFRQLMINGMKTDYSWTEPAQHYREIYDFIREK